MASFAIEVTSTCPPSQAIPGQYLVRIKSSIDSMSATSEKVFSSTALTPLNRSKDSNLGTNSKLKTQFAAQVETYFAEVNTDEDLESLLGSEDVLSVERNCRIRKMDLPNDPDVSKNIGLSVIRASEAWSIISKSSVIVAVSDTGVDIQHPDLQANIWRNQSELNGLPGVDDDSNGFVDDLYGWGFPESTNDPSPGNYEGADHGTHVAGVIGATGNNGSGVAGVAWSVQMMPLRTFKKTTEDAALSDLLASVYYAANNGAQILNCSWGIEAKPSQAELDAYAYAESRGVFVVAAAGNDSKDVSLYSPASISTVFAVGSINSRRELSSFSSYGIKIGSLAPGGDVTTTFDTGMEERIYSTIPGGAYDTKVGTSISAPFVSGVAALVKTLLPKITPNNMARFLHESGDLVSIRKAGVTQTYSLLNSEKAVTLAQQVARVNPACSDNCIQSGTLEFASNTPTELTKFGNSGCALFKQDGFRSAGTSPWDLAFLLSALIPFVVERLRRQRWFRSK